MILNYQGIEIDELWHSQKAQGWKCWNERKYVNSSERGFGSPSVCINICRTSEILKEPLFYLAMPVSPVLIFDLRLLKKVSFTENVE